MTPEQDTSRAQQPQRKLPQFLLQETLMKENKTRWAHTPGNPYSRRPKPTIVVTGAITIGLTNLPTSNEERERERKRRIELASICFKADHSKRNFRN
jgi:hypothetical protein